MRKNTSNNLIRQEMYYKLDKVIEEFSSKLDQRDFDEFDEVLRKKIEELQSHLL